MVTPRTILITGSSSGIGLMAAKMLFRDDEAKHVRVAMCHDKNVLDTAMYSPSYS